jgi:hypothetical protein
LDPQVTPPQSHELAFFRLPCSCAHGLTTGGAAATSKHLLPVALVTSQNALLPQASVPHMHASAFFTKPCVFWHVFNVAQEPRVVSQNSLAEQTGDVAVALLAHTQSLPVAFATKPFLLTH